MWFLNHFIITTLTITINLSILRQVPGVDKFSADLVVELVLLPILIFSAMFLVLTSSRLIWLWSFWVLRWVVWLTYLSPRWNVNKNWWNVDRNWQDLEKLGSGQFFTVSILLSFIYRLLVTLSKLTPWRAQSNKSHYSWPATVMGGKLFWAFQPHLPYLLLNFLMIWLGLLWASG